MASGAAWSSLIFLVETPVLLYLPVSFSASYISPGDVATVLARSSSLGFIHWRILYTIGTGVGLL